MFISTYFFLRFKEKKNLKNTQKNLQKKFKPKPIFNVFKKFKSHQLNPPDCGQKISVFFTALASKCNTKLWIPYFHPISILYLFSVCFDNQYGILKNSYRKSFIVWDIYHLFFFHLLSVFFFFFQFLFLLKVISNI